MVRLVYYNKFAIISLFLIELFFGIFLVGIIILLVVDYTKADLYCILTISLLSLEILCIIIQVIIYFCSKGFVDFDTSGIEVSGKKKIYISWNRVINFIFIDHFTLTEFLSPIAGIPMALPYGRKYLFITFDFIDNNLDFGESSICCNKNQYLEIIKLIPEYLLDGIDFYGNDEERKNDRYNIYKRDK